MAAASFSTFHCGRRFAPLQVHEQLMFLVVQWVGALLGLYITGAFVSVVSGEDLTVSEEVSLFCKVGGGHRMMHAGLPVGQGEAHVCSL